MEILVLDRDIDSCGPLFRYRNTPVIQDGSIVYNDLPDVVDIGESVDDIYHTVTIQEENRIDVVAYNFYGNVGFWWILASANNIVDPTVLEAGSILRIPPRKSFYAIGGVLA